MSADLIPICVSKGRKVAIVIVAIGWMTVLFGCRYSPPHPPTCTDFHRLGSGVWEDEKKPEARLSSLSTYISIVGRQLFNDPQLDRATAEACLELGRRYEAQATLFIDQLIAFSIQKRALEFLKPPGFEAELQRMTDTKDNIRKAIRFLDSDKAHAASEREWLAYFEILFEKSEVEAVNGFAAKLNYKL